MNKIIRIIIKEDCEGCNIAKKLVKKAIIESEIKDIKLEIINCIDIEYKQFIESNNINCFPTIIFMDDKTILKKFTGAKSVPRIIEEINILFT